MSDRTAGGEPLFAAGDAVANELLSSLQPLLFEEAQGTADRQAAFRLRYRAVVERGMKAPEDLPDGVERDAFDDDRAVQILAWDGSRPIGTCRLLPAVPGRAFPVEAFFGIRVAGAERMVEWGRVVVDPEYRGDGHSVLMGLAARGWLSMRVRGFTAALGATPPRLVRLLDALGFRVTVLAPPRMHWGEERCLFVCDGRTAIPELEQRWIAGAADTAVSRVTAAPTPSDRAM